MARPRAPRRSVSTKYATIRGKTRAMTTPSAAGPTGVATAAAGAVHGTTGAPGSRSDGVSAAGPVQPTGAAEMIPPGVDSSAAGVVGGEGSAGGVLSDSVGETPGGVLSATGNRAVSASGSASAGRGGESGGWSPSGVCQ